MLYNKNKNHRIRNHTNGYHTNRCHTNRYHNNRYHKNRTLRIGLDLDGVICDYYSELVKSLNEEVDPGIRLENLTEYNIAAIFGWSSEEAERFFNKDYDRGTFLRVKPNTGAIETINELHQAGHEIYIITSRNTIHSEHTCQWLLEHNLLFTGLLFEKDKLCSAKNLGIDLFVDDDPYQVKRMLETGIDCLVYDQPVNRRLSEAKRVFSWNEIHRYIESIIESIRVC